MKIKPEDLEKLKECIGEVLKEQPNAAAQYQRLNMTHKHYRWDVLWAASNACKRKHGKPLIGSSTAPGYANLYDYLDDDHIDTALRSILGSSYT